METINLLSQGIISQVMSVYLQNKKSYPNEITLRREIIDMFMSIIFDHFITEDDQENIENIRYLIPSTIKPLLLFLEFKKEEYKEKNDIEKYEEFLYLIDKLQSLMK